MKNQQIAIRTLEFNIAMLEGGINYLEKEGLNKRAKKLKAVVADYRTDLAILKSQYINAKFPVAP